MKKGRPKGRGWSDWERAKHLARRAEERKSNAERGGKVCQRCGEFKLFSEYSPGDGMNGYETRCRPCMVKKASAYNKLNPDKRSRNELRYSQSELGRLRDIRAQCRRMNFVIEDRAAIWIHQDKKCAICADDIPLMSKNSHLDHCHVTGTFRGLLCGHCNAMLGYCRDNQDTLLKAVEYLKDGGKGIAHLINRPKPAA